MLLFGRLSGVMSRRWTTCSLFNLSTKVENRSFLICPMGTTNALILAGAMGKRGSKLILAFESFLQGSRHSALVTMPDMSMPTAAGV